VRAGSLEADLVWINTLVDEFDSLFDKALRASVKFDI
jgi:hypothetical protein